MGKRINDNLSIRFSGEGGFVAPVDKNGLIILASGEEDKYEVVASPKFLEDLIRISNETPEERTEKKKQWKKRLNLILESQVEYVFFQTGDLKWSVENTGGMHWEDFILLNLNDPTDDVFAFTFITEHLVKQDMKEALANGYYRKEDYIDRVDTITVKHPAMTCNDLGRIIRLWINKFYPHYATIPMYLSVGENDPRDRLQWIPI